MPLLCLALLHNNLSTKLLHSSNDLLSILLGNVLLHHLWCALDELLAVHQAEAEQALDLLDNLGLGGSVELLQLQGEQRLLGGGGGSVFWLFDDGSGSRSGSSEATNGHVGDVELALLGGQCQCSVGHLGLEIQTGETNLEARNKVCSLQKSELADLVDNAGNLGVLGSGLGGVVSSRH